MNQVPRLRMFAGPNGSGKSTLINTLKNALQPELLGIYINPDEIEKGILQNGYLDLADYEITTNKDEVLSFFIDSKLLAKAEMLKEAQQLKFESQKIIFLKTIVNAYFASVCADFIRRKLIQMKKSFTFETVMSSDDKIEMLKEAQKLGYRTYLYYVATSDSLINISRVKLRVAQGGHDVPEDKIVSRYTRSLSKLSEAIRFSDRAYIFDNSEESHVWLAEITSAKEINIKQDSIPQWFQQYVLDALSKGAA